VQAYDKDEELPGNKEGTVLFTGDIMLTRTIGSIMERRNNDYHYPFQKIDGFLKGADIVCGNLEGPISNRGTKGGGKYSFRDDPGVVTGLKNAGFTILTIANNHIWDYGRDAFIDTLANLKSAGIAPLGGGTNFNETHRGVLKNIKGTRVIFLGYTDLLPRSTGVSEDSAGISYLDIEQVKRDIKIAKDKADIVIVSFHWGREYQTKPSGRQEQIARAAINAGASLVIGHHPHVIQPVEEYGGGYIAYSLGNFIFDQNLSPDTQRGLVIKVVLGKKKIRYIEQYKIGFTHTYQPFLLF
jgi:poly-gamma-glutamate synthesis protein (capsule biosynthesis protein)